MPSKTFLRQADKPLFADTLWEQPVNKKAAKKLLIVGGNRANFQSVQAAYQAARNAGIGQAKIVLPDALREVIGERPDCLYVPSTKAGSIDKSATGRILVFAKESDGMLITDDLSKNPDTMAMLRSLIAQAEKPMALTEGLLEMLLFDPAAIFTGPQKLLVASAKTYRKLAGKLELSVQSNITHDLISNISLLKTLALNRPANYVLLNNQTIVYSKPRCSVSNKSLTNQTTATAWLMTYMLQHQDPFKALTTAAYQLGRDHQSPQN